MKILVLLLFINRNSTIIPIISLLNLLFMAIIPSTPENPTSCVITVRNKVIPKKLVTNCMASPLHLQGIIGTTRRLLQRHKMKFLSLMALSLQILQLHNIINFFLSLLKMILIIFQMTLQMKTTTAF